MAGREELPPLQKWPKQKAIVQQTSQDEKIVECPTPPLSEHKPEVALPGPGRQKREFCVDMAIHLAPLHLLFQKGKEVVELVMEDFDTQLDERGLAHGGFKFQEMEACRATTWVEDYVVVGRNIKKER
jgi:hypothetical protein